MNEKPESIWKWEEGSVNRDDEHIKVGYGGFEEEFVPIALVAPGKDNCFVVEFLKSESSLEKEKPGIVDEVKRDLDFFLVELREPDPWRYAIYHCGTASNAYSSVRWAYFPKGWEVKSS